MNNPPNRSQLILGVLLIGLGVWFFAQNAVPSFAAFTETFARWPFSLIWLGAGLLLFGMLTGNPGLAVPAAIVAGIGGIFYSNETYHTDWSFMWTLIPGFVGVGSVLQGLLGENTRRNIARGLNTMVTSAVLFLIFAALFGGLEVLGNSTAAIALIALGVWLLARNLWRGRPGGTAGMGGTNA